jgi:hypothetical protein
MQQFVDSLKGCFPVQHFSRTAVKQLLNPIDAAGQAKRSEDERLPEQSLTVWLDRRAGI